MDIIVSGLLLSGTYALVAMGLNLQYGVARIMNLANGELLVLGALASFWLYTTSQISPLFTVLLVAPIAFVGNWLIYRFLLIPLVRRSKTQGHLEVDSILATFGMSFILIGLMVSIEGGFFVYKYLSIPISILGSTTSLSRLVAFIIAALIGSMLYLWLNHTRSGVAVRAVSVSTEASGLVGINVPRVSALAFALGGAITAVGGALISTFITLDASIGVVFTLKALIIVIMGGVGDIRGAIVAAIILGVVETTVATLIDPGLTLAAAYFIFLNYSVISSTGPLWEASVMKPSGWIELLFAAILVFLAIFIPLFSNGYWLSIAVTAMMYIALSTSWALFSGPTHYISLATGAFYGVGGYLGWCWDVRLPIKFLVDARYKPNCCCLACLFDRHRDSTSVGCIFCNFYTGPSRNDPQPCFMGTK